MKFTNRLARIDNALEVAAELIERFGEQYLPAFERLEKMRADEVAKGDVLSRVRRLAAARKTTSSPITFR